MIQENEIEVTEIVSGGASGVDTMAERYGNEKGIPVKKFNADWKKYIFCLYSPFCSCIYFILSGLTPFDEEFKENEEEDEERERERGNNARDDLDTGNQMVSDTNNSNN